MAFVKRALFALVLVASTLTPAAAPVGAQTAPQSVTLTPAAPVVAPGGRITVNATNFPCEATIIVDLMDSSGTVFVVNLGTMFASCATATTTGSFTIPTSVVPGTYRVRASDDFGHSAVSAGADGLITVSNGVVINGTAQCAGFDFPLLGATVQLFSGTALVATTTADSQTGAYSFFGAPAGATYQVRYLDTNVDGPAINCGTVVTTNSDGGRVPPTQVCPNEAWDNAQALTSGVSASDTICKPNQSIWRKISIAPGQQISIVVGNATGKTRVALFRDLRADFRKLLANPTGVNLQQLDATMSGQASAPWDASPWDASPWDASPWDASPWDASPWDASPWDASPWDASPFDASQLCTDAKVDPTQVSANACAGAYTLVQMRDLIAFSANGQIFHNTWDNSGDYYIRVFNQDATFNPAQTLTVLATVIGTCGVPPETGTAPAIIKNSSSFLTANGTTTTLPGGKTTLILTNSSRLKGPNGLPVNDPSNGALKATFQTTVNTFAAQPNVNGLVVDFANDNGLQADFSQWDTPPFPSCPAAANNVTEAIHDLINAYRLQSGPAFKYVTILGGHTVIPYRLAPDHAELQQENTYDPGLIDLSKSAASLASAYVMTDSYYISFNPISRLESEVSLPDPNLAVGRIVEFADDISNNLQAFIDNAGVMHPTAALATGYTFVKDLATTELTDFQQAGLTDTDSLISDTWTAPDLKGKIFDPARDGVTGSNFDILAINWHARSNEAVAADYATTHPTVVKSSDIANWTADQRFRNILVMSIGCHLAYPLLNADVIGNPTNPPQFVTDAQAFTETFQNKGAMVLGNTGYGYGDTDFEGYSERLLAIVTQQLDSGTAGDGGVPVGLAVTNAKRQYIQGFAALTGVDKKALEELTFYGPPMWRVDFPVRTALPNGNSLTINPQSADAFHGLSSATVSPPYGLVQKQLNQGDSSTTYFETDDGGKQEMPYRADLPYKSFDVSRPAFGTARGVALISADYADQGNTTSTVSVPATEQSSARPGWVTHGFWPLQTFGLNEFAGQSLFLTPIQWLASNVAGTLGVTRSYPDSTKTTLRVYYSNATDASVFAGPATIGDVNVSVAGHSRSLVHVDVTVGGATISDIHDVLISYTGTNSSSPFYLHWQTCSLVPGRLDSSTTTHACSTNTSEITTFANVGSFVRHYSGDIAAGTASNASDLHLVVQVVTGSGLVSTRNNNGQYFAAESATIFNPKAHTALTLGSVPNPVTYDHSATFTATLTSDRSTCAVNNRLVVFHLGSQAKTVVTDAGGGASATFNVLTIPTTIDGKTPAPYPLIVTFAETPDCLSSLVSQSPVNVNKKNTSLAFGTTPYLAKLTDADGLALRDEFIFFTVKNGSGVTATRSAQTDAFGVGQLRDLQLPDGTYTVTVSFPGTIPTTSGTIQLTDVRYNPAAPISTTLTADLKSPSCALTGSGSLNGVAFIKITVQDTNSGLAAVNPTELVNATLSIPSYSAGQRTSLVVTAFKTDQTMSSQVGLEVDDVAGNVTSCDPILTSVGLDGPGGLPRSETFHHIAHGESFITVANNTPGLTRLLLVINGHRFELRDLQDGEQRTINVAAAMRKGQNNTIKLTAQGKPGGSAVIVISDVT